MRAVITGGAGYVGTELVAQLVASPEIEEIVVYDNLSRGNYNLFLGVPRLPHQRVKFINADILDSRSLEAATQGAGIVYHLAAKVTTPFADHGPHGFEQINHWGAAEVANAIEKNQVPSAVFLSSVSVYGSTPEEVDESHEPNPQTFYGISKANGEAHFARLFEKLRCFTIRCGNVYGYSSSMRFDSVINRFMFDANFRGRLQIDGDGNQMRSFAHIDTVAKVLANLNSSSLPSGVFNLVEETLSVNQIVASIQKIYPTVERIHINRDVKLRELKAMPNLRINQLSRSPRTDMDDALNRFSESFSF